MQIVVSVMMHMKSYFNVILYECSKLGAPPSVWGWGCEALSTISEFAMSQNIFEIKEVFVGMKL